MLELIINYWLEFLLTIISSGLIAACTYLYKLYKNEKKRRKSESDQHIIDEVKSIMDDHDRDILKLIREEELASQKADTKTEEKMKLIQTELSTLKKGMLSIQGKQFKDECRMLLEKKESITLEEYQNLANEHTVYNALDGNHEGDELFRLVDVKYKAQLQR